MNLLRRLCCCFGFVLATFALRAQAADPGQVSGIVIDPTGKPLAGVSVTLSSRQATSQPLHTTTDAAGQYRFSGIAPGEYTLIAQLGGYTASDQPMVRVIPDGKPLLVNIALTAAQTQGPPKPKLQFEASGLHGLIDPGGYSATANADAASGIMRGMADSKRGDRSFGMVYLKQWLCDLEPGLQKALVDDPNSAQANRNLGQFYVAHDQPEKAIPLLQHALQIDATDDAASRSLAVARMQSGQFDEARKQLAAWVATHDTAETHRLLAHAEEGLGLFQQAAQEYRIADRKEPEEENLFGIGYELILAGSPATALPAFLDGLRTYPSSISLRMGAGTAQFLTGHAGDAVKSFLDATDLDPKDPRPYSLLAAASGVAGTDKERVKSSFQRYLERAPESAQANYLEALVLSRDTADTPQVEALLRRALGLDAGLTRAHLQLADLYASRGSFDQAIAEYKWAVRLEPELNEAHYRLAIVLKRAGQNDESAREMQLFQAEKASQGSNGEGIDTAQFISVMDAPGGNSSAWMQCPATTR